MATAVTLDPRYTGPLIIESYLKKLKRGGHSALFTSKFTKRWFVLDLRSGSFHYTASKNKAKPERAYTLSDILSVDINPKVTEICDWKFSFVVETTDRSYFLYAESVSMHTLWCTALLALVKVPMNSGDPGHLRPTPSEQYREDYRDADTAQYPQDDAEPRQLQDVDAQARTPSPIDDREPVQQPSESLRPPQETIIRPPPEQVMEEPPPKIPDRRQQYQGEARPQYQEERPQYKEEPRPQYQEAPAEPIPEGTFVRISENTEKAAAVRRSQQSALPEDSGDLVVTNPSRFSDSRKGPVVGESSYHGQEKDSIWGQRGSDMQSVIKVEKPDLTAKEEGKHIKREQIVKRGEPVARMEQKTVVPPKAKPVEQPAPAAPFAPAAIKESLNLGKGGFHDILDEMSNLSQPPEDLEKERSLWGGKSAKSKKAESAARPTEQKPVLVYSKSAQQVDPQPVYSRQAAASQDFEPQPPVSKPESAYRQPAYDPRPPQAYDPRPVIPPPTYEQPPPYSKQPSANDPRPAAYDPRPPQAYDPRPVIPPPTYEQPPPYSKQPSANDPRPAAYDPQPPAYDPRPQAYDPRPAAYEPRPPAYDPRPQAYDPRPAAYEPRPAAYDPRPPAYEPRPPAYDPRPHAYDPRPPAYEPQPVYSETQKRKPERPARYAGTAYTEKTEVRSDARKEENWDDDEEPQVAGTDTRSNPPPAVHAKGKINYDDWDD